MTDNLKEMIHNDRFTISENAKNRLDKTLSSINKKRRLNTLKLVPIAAIFIFAILTSAFLIRPSLAQDIPGLSYIFNHLLGYNGEYDKYSEVINQTVSDKGYIITLDNAVLDDKDLVLGFTIKSNTEMTQSPNIMENSCYMNGKWLNVSSSGGGSFKDKFTYIETFSLNLSGVKVPEKADFEFKIKGISKTLDADPVQGNWSFRFKASKSASDKNSHEFKINQKVLFGGKYITINKVIITPLNTTVYFTGSIPSDNEFRYVMKDNKGIQVQNKGGEYGSSGGYMQFDRLNGIPDYITIQPYFVSMPTWINVNLGKFPLKISQGKMGSITIEKITSLTDRTEVYYSVDGIYPLDQAAPLALIDKNGKAYNRTYMPEPEQLDSIQKRFLSVFQPFKKGEITGISTINFDTYYKLLDPVKINLK